MSMTDEQATRIEAKLDQILDFQNQLQSLLGVYLNGGTTKLLAALMGRGHK